MGLERHGRGIFQGQRASHDELSLESVVVNYLQPRLRFVADRKLSLDTPRYFNLTRFRLRARHVSFFDAQHWPRSFAS